MIKALKLTLIFLFTTQCMIAQHILEFDSLIGSPKADISQLNWLAGHWRGEAFGGQIGEIWSPYVGTSMLFSCQAASEDRVTFYEFGTITEENNTLVFRLKHFHSDLRGWEEKDERLERPLVKISPNIAFFHNFTFEKISEEEINVYVMFKDEVSPPFEMKFNYKRL